MRSSRSRPDPVLPDLLDPLDPGAPGFAHRGLHGAPPFAENSLNAFRAAIELGAGIECDLRLTSDRQLVVFHDADAARLCGDPAVIADSSLADLAALRVGGAPIPTLEQLLALVAGRVPLLLEVKADGSPGRIGPALVEALAGYRGPFGVMSFDPRVARWLKTNAPSIRRGLVIEDRLPRHRRWWAMTLADPHFLAVETTALARRWVERARRTRPVYTWTVATPDQRAAAARRADAPIWEADGRP